MIQAELDAIAERHLQSLVDLEIPEDLTLDYKLTLPGRADDDMKEFLADVTALANTAGGDLVFGIAAGKNADGNTVPTGIAPIVVDADSELLRLDNVLRDCVKPRLVGYRFRQVPVGGAGFVWVLRVPRSWHGPHVVEFKKHWRFYGRGAAGKYMMDISQVRDAFGLTSSLAERIEAYRAARLDEIRADETMADGPRLVLHLVPFESLRPGFAVDLELARARSNLIFPISAHDDGHASGFKAVYAFDGLEVVDERTGTSEEYVKLSRTGVVEAVDVILLDYQNRSRSRPGEPGVIEDRFAEYVLAAAGHYLEALRRLGLGGPVAMMLTLLGVKDRRLCTPKDHWGRSTNAARAIRYDDLLLPTAVVDASGSDLAENLQRMLDVLWNAGGKPRAPRRLVGDAAPAPEAPSA